VLFLRLDLLCLPFKTLLLFFDQNLHSELFIGLQTALLSHILALEILVLDVIQEACGVTAAVRQVIVLWVWTHVDLLLINLLLHFVLLVQPAHSLYQLD
jgi:hypothetical protein